MIALGFVISFSAAALLALKALKERMILSRVHTLVGHAPGGSRLD
jgi:hypothetical protein